MRIAQLDQIVRKRDPELLKAVQHLANNENAAGVKLLANQGRVTEVLNPQDGIAAIARDYAAKPENTIIISPDNRRRQRINDAVRSELQATGALDSRSLRFETSPIAPTLTGPDRSWAVRYRLGNVVEYTTGSKQLSIERGSSAIVIDTNVRENTVTVERSDGQTVTHDVRCPM